MIHKEILPKEQLKIYDKLSFLKDKGFVLFGGTALALQIGHRVSVDFDFFIKDVLNNKLKELIQKELKADIILQDEINTLVYIKNDVKLSFFGNIDFANEQNSFMLDDVLRVANLQSLLATKIKATFDRATYKDYKDIVELLKQKDIDLDIGINKMFEFFGNEFSTSQILRNLTYFEDGDLNKLNQDDRKILIDISRNYTEQIMQEIRKAVNSKKETDTNTSTSINQNLNRR